MGDLLFTTDNPVLLRNQHNLPALNCIQYNAKKDLITEELLIKSNKQGFGSKIGQITNRITEMTSLMANFDKDSMEYKTLQYRVQCGQAQQQAEIDKAKGIISNPMPKSWYIWKENVIKDDDDDETIAHKLLYQKVCAHKKPYFFQYNYSSLRSEYLSYVKQANENCASLFHKSLDLLLHSQDLTPDEQRFVQTYQNKMILDLSPSTMNRICWHIEKCFDGVIWPKVGAFDYTMLKSDNQYTLQDFALIKKLCKTYQSDCALVFKNDDDTDAAQLLKLLSEQINMVVSNQYIQCNILLDLCYQHGMPKQIVWELCGDVIVENLLHSHNNTLQYPKKDDSGEFFCCGHRFSMETLIYGGDKDEEF